MVEALTVVSILLGLFTFAAAGFAAWLYRHETWFRDIVFPHIQVLTGTNPRGGDLPLDGHIQESGDRLDDLENRVGRVSTQVDDLSREQKRRHRETEAFLRRIIRQLDGVSEDEFDDPLWRGGGGDGQETD